MSELDGLRLVGSLALAYGVGSLPTGYLLSRFVKGVDIRSHGSGNIGATNVHRVLGKKWGAITLLLDMGKSFCVVEFFHHHNFKPQRIAVISLALLLGNCFSLFLKGKGGKGVATTFGIYLALSPVVFLWGGSAYLFGIGITRISAVGSFLSCLVWPFASHMLIPEFFNLSVVMSVLVVARHHSNIKAEFKKLQNMFWLYVKCK